MDVPRRGLLVCLLTLACVDATAVVTKTAAQDKAALAIWHTCTQLCKAAGGNRLAVRGMADKRGRQELYGIECGGGDYGGPGHPRHGGQLRVLGPNGVYILGVMNCDHTKIKKFLKTDWQRPDKKPLFLSKKESGQSDTYKVEFFDVERLKDGVAVKNAIEVMYRG